MIVEDNIKAYGKFIDKINKEVLKKTMEIIREIEVYGAEGVAEINLKFSFENDESDPLIIERKITLHFER